MRLLAIVENNLRAVLERNLGCEVDFYSAWQNVDPSELPSYGCVVASGILIEDLENPLAIWGVASAIRYFSVPAIFVDTSFEAGNLIPRVYPQIKLVSYQGDANQFLLQLRTCAPQLFFENPRFSSSLSASANAWRYQETSRSSDINVSLDGARQSAVFEQGVQQSGAMTGSFGAVSSIPLGMQRSVSSCVPTSQAPLTPSATFRKEGMGPGRLDDSDGFDFKLSDISSSSSISGLEAISDILNAASSESNQRVQRATAEQQDANQPAPAAQPRGQIANSTNAFSAASISVDRMAKDVQNGRIEFGSLIRVAVTMMRLKLTGVMEIQSDMRSVRLEFRHGEPFANCSSQAILSALCWSTGEFNFNATRLLSVNSSSVDLWHLIHTAVREQFPLQTVYRILESNFPHYIAYSNFFEKAHHAQLKPIFALLGGQHTVQECLQQDQEHVEIIAREIYLAYLSDDICLFDRAVPAPIMIQYEVMPDPNQSSHHSASSQLSDAALDNSQINMVRTDLLRVRASFETDDGYKILGLQPGCGVTALDDAYYAWINRYHSDRFVRYNDPSFVKLANELLMLMNSTYSKLAKAERANSGSRIGVGRARLSTINSSSRPGRSGSALLESQPPATVTEDKIIRRPAIKKSSGHSMDSVTVDPNKSRPNRMTPKPSGQVLTMSEVLAKRTNSIAQESSVEPVISDQPSQPEIVRSPSVLLRAPSSVRRTSSASMPANNATAQQHFATAKKKLALGLAKDALTAMEWALQAEPENIEYQAFKAYAAFLVDATLRDNSIDIVQKVIEKMKAAGETDLLFSPYYFIGKMQMAAENYPAAKDALHRASKINPNDVDTQRSIRYVDMQLDKAKEVPQSKGLFSSLKEKLTKKL